MKIFGKDYQSLGTAPGTLSPIVSDVPVTIHLLDHGFPLLERYGEQIEALEEQLLDNPGQGTLADIYPSSPP